MFDEGYSKADVLNEALNQARVEETGLHIPKLREVTMIDGRWAIVSDYIKGKTLSRMMQESPDKKEEYLNLFVNLQVEMYAKTCPLLGRLKDKINRKICQTDFDTVTRHDLHVRLDSMPECDSLCHGDFYPENVVITNGGTPYILDWAHAAQENAFADAACTYLLFWLNGDISGAERYLELFCEKKNITEQDIRMWMPLIAASQSVGGRKAEREFLRSWVF